MTALYFLSKLILMHILLCSSVFTNLFTALLCLNHLCIFLKNETKMIYGNFMLGCNNQLLKNSIYILGDLSILK